VIPSGRSPPETENQTETLPIEEGDPGFTRDDDGAIARSGPTDGVLRRLEIPRDYLAVAAKVPAAEAFRLPGAGGCALGVQ